MKILVIAEKPSVARTIAQAMGGGNKSDGYIESEEYVFSWCAGHLVELFDAADYDEALKTWDMADLPILPDVWKYKVLPDAKKQFAVLKKLMERSDVETVVNACDAGREGELIFRLTYNHAGCGKTMRRLWLQSMEEAAIRAAMAALAPGEEYDSLYDAASCRQRADWAVGINASRLFGMRFHAKLSVGRVVTPTLALVTARQSEIENFHPEPFWKVHLDLKGGDAASGKIGSEQEVRRLAAACAESVAEITDIQRQDRKQNPPKLFDLTSVQREANRLFGYTAQKTLDICQSLYEQGMASYPRTDSRYLTDDMEETAREIIRAAQESWPHLGGGGQDIARVLNSKKVTDHYAVIPTLKGAKSGGEGLAEDEARILGLLACRLATATGTPRLYTQTKITAACAGSEFKMSGSVTTDPGWTADEKEAMAFLKAKPDKQPLKDGEEDEAVERELPSYALHEKFEHPKSSITQHQTTPPPSYTEATLLSAMEKAGASEVTEEVERKGLGTPATRASMIEKLVNGGLIQRKQKSLAATKTGMALTRALPSELTSPSMTADWENRLSRIARGEENPDQFMSDIGSYVRSIVKENSGPVDPQIAALFASSGGRKVVGKCPRCGADVVANKKGWGCSNRDCKFMLWKDDRFFQWKKVAFTEKMAKDLLKDGKTFVTGLYSEKKDKTYDAYVVLSDPGEGYVKFALEFSDDKPKKSGKGKKRA